MIRKIVLQNGNHVVENIKEEKEIRIKIDEGGNNVSLEERKQNSRSKKHGYYS